MPHEVAGEIYYIKQKVDYLEAITASLGFQCCEQSNFYSIIDSKGEVAYTAEEKSGCLCRCCCAPNHKFQLDIHEGKEVKSEPVMTMYHPFKFPPCCPICCDIQRGEIIVYDGKVNAYDDDEKGEVISHVKQPVGGGGFHPSFQVWEGEANDDKDPTYTVEGPCCCIGGICGECFFPPTFNVKAGKGGEEEEVLSEIKKDKPEGLGGAAKTMLTDADNFTIHMPNGASTQTRAAILATSLLVDYAFFEEDGNCYLAHGTEETRLVCRCCNLYCYGCICPCNLNIPLSGQQQDG
mmetsp:Transcript_1706/g.3285  ORF Transcript_1706/g.3285 Transcript_1706/m.3285 type:complete len:293 (+) Transcript_1706:55-933(+)